MIDQSVRLAMLVSANFTAFTLNFVLTGNLAYALDVLTQIHEAQKNDQTAVENLFWD